MRVFAYHKLRALTALLLATAGLTLVTSSVAAAPITIDLCATSGTLALPGGASADVWGFGLAGADGSCAGVPPMVPGPVLTVDAGDTVTIVVQNGLGESVSLEVPGEAINEGAAEAPAGGTATYTFTASAPGTYLYQSPAHAGRQLAMGLYGAFVVRSATDGRAYGDASTAYDRQAVLVLSAIDPAFNADPGGYDMTKYAATYWLINGKAYPDTDPVHGVAPGTRVLLRYLNAGFDNSTMLLLGTHERVIARDARPLANPFDAVAETIPAGGTEDTIVTIPATGNRFALYNRQLHLTNGGPDNPSHTPGGMLTFIQVP